MALEFIVPHRLPVPQIALIAPQYPSNHTLSHLFSLNSKPMNQFCQRVSHSVTASGQLHLMSASRLRVMTSRIGGLDADNRLWCQPQFKRADNCSHDYNSNENRFGFGRSSIEFIYKCWHTSCSHLGSSVSHSFSLNKVGKEIRT